VAGPIATPTAAAMATREPSCLRPRPCVFYSVRKRRAAARFGLQAKRKRESRNNLAARFCYKLLQIKTQRRLALLQPLENVTTADSVVKPMNVVEPQLTKPGSDSPFARLDPDCGPYCPIIRSTPVTPLGGDRS
jgi:hypothetical protein